MSLRATCPNGHVVVVPETALGKTLCCAKCKALFVFSAPAEPPAPPRPSAPPSAPRPPVPSVPPAVARAEPRPVASVAATPEHESVEETAAIAVPADYEGAEDEVKLCVVLEEGEEVDPVDLHEHCEQGMPHFAVPRYIEFMEEIPKTANGKVMKKDLREQGVTEDTWDREEAGVEVGK